MPQATNPYAPPHEPPELLASADLPSSSREAARTSRWLAGVLAIGATCWCVGVPWCMLATFVSLVGLLVDPGERPAAWTWE